MSKCRDILNGSVSLLNYVRKFCFYSYYFIFIFHFVYSYIKQIFLHLCICLREGGETVETVVQCCAADERDA